MRLQTVGLCEERAFQHVQGGCSALDSDGTHVPAGQHLLENTAIGCLVVCDEGSAISQSVPSGQPLAFRFLNLETRGENESSRGLVGSPLRYRRP